MPWWSSLDASDSSRNCRSDDEGSLNITFTASRGRVTVLATISSVSKTAPNVPIPRSLRKWYLRSRTWPSRAARKPTSMEPTFPRTPGS